MHREIDAILRALQGTCIDCRGRGRRVSFTGSQVQCMTCGGVGRLRELTACQVACATKLSVTHALELLLELAENGTVSRSESHGVDYWHRRAA